VLIKNEVMEKVISFASNNIQSPNWKMKYAALISLGSITDGPEKAKFMEVIMQALPSLLGLSKDPVAKVREALAWVLSRICEFHPEVVKHEQVTSVFVPTLI